MTSKQPERPAKRPKRQTNGISIPDDVLVSKIFVRLPARSVVAVRLVCKSWFSLTTSPHFVLSHARRAAASRPNILFESEGEYTLYHESEADLDLPSKMLEYVAGVHSELRLSGSSDGLLCFDLEGRPSTNGRRRRLGYVVCNPLTKDWIIVPRNSLRNNDDYEGSTIAFYFHSSTGEYRLLQQYYVRGGGYRYEVFNIAGSNRSGAWRPINASPGISARAYDLMRSEDISVHGSIHFLYFPLGDGDDDRRDCIVAFDTDTEKFRKMFLPARMRLRRYYYGLTGMGGSLGLCHMSLDSTAIDLWCLKDYTKEEWVKQHTVTVRDITGEPHPTFHVVPLAIWDYGKELLVIYDRGCFALYNFESKTSKKKEINKFRRTCVGMWVPYIETLVPCNYLK